MLGKLGANLLSAACCTIMTFSSSLIDFYDNMQAPDHSVFLTSRYHLV